MSCKIAICWPSSGTCQAFFAQSLATLINECSHKTYDEFEDIEFKILLQQGSVIHMNREALVDAALKEEVDYILFIDDDMAVHPDAFISLLKRKQAVVAVNYPQRFFPIKFTAVEKDGVTIVKTENESKGIQEVGFIGFGLCLMHTAIFKDLPKPWFLPKYVKETNIYTTEDYPFIEKVRQHGYSIFIDHDASKLVGHVGQHLYRWHQI